MGVICVIPARGGSKSVPGKNLRTVGGVPLVARAVRAALSVAAIDRVVVSTDDDGIALAAISAGAEVLDRPAELAGDAVSPEAVLLHALDALECDAPPIDVLVLLQATSPFVDTVALSGAVARVAAGDADAVFSAIPTRVFLWSRGDTGAVGVNHDSAHRLRRQDREPHWAETGAFYVLDVDGFRSSGHRFFGRIGFAPVDPRGAIEIDTPQDLELADALAAFVDPAPEPERPSRIEADALALDPRVMPSEERVMLVDDGQGTVPRVAADGRAVARLADAGLPFLLVSSEVRRPSRVVPVPTDVVRGSDDKAAALEYWALHRGVELDRVAYLGTGLDDIDALASVGWPVCTADAPAAVRAICRVVLESTSAGGAVREVAERMLADHPAHARIPAPTPIHELVRTDRTVHDLVRPPHVEPARRREGAQP